MSVEIKADYRELSVDLFSGFKIYNDVETSGLSPVKNDVIVSSFIVADKDMNELAAKTFYIPPLNPGSWELGAQKIHGITLEQALAHLDTAIDILWFLKPFLVEGKYAEFISHSLNDFDFKMMEWLYRKQGLEYSFWKMFNHQQTRSTIEEARKKLQLSNYKLNTVCAHYNIQLDHHNAESDVRACFEIDKRLL